MDPVPQKDPSFRNSSLGSMPRLIVKALIFPEMEKVLQVGNNAQFQEAQFVTRAQNFYSMLSYSFLLLFKSKLACYMSIFLKAVIQEIGNEPSFAYYFLKLNQRNGNLIIIDWASISYIGRQD